VNIFLVLEKLSFYYSSSQPLLKEIDFELKQGDKVALLGNNGSGKTTLFYLIVGLLKPISGKLYLFGRTPSIEQDFQSLRLQIGFLFQDSDDQLFCPTVLDDVMFGVLNQGKSFKEAQHIARETLKKLRLEKFIDSTPLKLSGGEKKLVALATILAMQPRLLLLDEPTNDLDDNTRQHLLEILQQLPQSMLIISHDQTFLKQLVNRSIFLKDGKLLEI
jgi:cobalt/nickel transport system ATP-binding protein